MDYYIRDKELSINQNTEFQVFVNGALQLQIDTISQTNGITLANTVMGLNLVKADTVRLVYNRPNVQSIFQFSFVISK